MNLDQLDPYETLGLKRKADQQAVAYAYRRLAKKYHPDTAAPEERPEYEERMKLINSAYEILSDPVKREIYDSQYPESTLRRQYAPEPTGPGGYVPASLVEAQQALSRGNYVLAISLSSRFLEYHPGHAYAQDILYTAKTALVSQTPQAARPSNESDYSVWWPFLTRFAMAYVMVYVFLGPYTWQAPGVPAPKFIALDIFVPFICAAYFSVSKAWDK